jgi:hypothetical protein
MTVQERAEMQAENGRSASALAEPLKQNIIEGELRNVWKMHVLRNQFTFQPSIDRARNERRV